MTTEHEVNFDELYGQNVEKIRGVLIEVYEVFLKAGVSLEEIGDLMHDLVGDARRDASAAIIRRISTKAEEKSSQ